MVSLIGFQFSGGQRRIGTRLAFQTLMRDQYIQELCVKSRANIIDLQPRHAPDNADLPTRVHFATLASALLRDAVRQELVRGRFPIIVGGDHSLAIGSISAAKSVYPNLHVTWVDAHLDLNNEHTSPSGNIHGFPVAVLGGYSDIFKDQFKSLVLSTDITYIGVRDCDPEEQQLASSLSIPVLRDLDQQRDQVTLQDRSRYRENWLSFDVDALDSRVITATGTPVEGGLSIGQAQNVIRSVIGGNQSKCVGMDLAELNFADFCPDSESCEKQLQVCRELLSEVFKHLQV